MISNQFKIALLLLFVGFTVLTVAQDTTKSSVIKSNKPRSIYPLIKPKYTSYPLMAGYLLQQHAREGDPFAQHELGLRFLLGQGFAPDTAKAIEWIKKAVSKNLTVAKYNYGIILNNGIGIEWNPFEAFKQFEYAAHAGMPLAQFVYGAYYTDNLVVPKNFTEAYIWFKRAAESDVEPAIEAVKRLEELGVTIPTNSDNTIVNQADSSFEASSVLSSNWELDFFEFESDSTGEEDQSKLVEQIMTKKPSELKNILGIHKELGKEELKDTSAQNLIRYAAENGSPEALLLEGAIKETTSDKIINKITAAEKYLKAYRLGAMKAVQNILKFSEDQKFFDELKKEIDKNKPDAMYVWAAMVAMGFDYRITSKQALDLLIRASEMDHIYSIIETGLCYYNGNLVDKNKEKAFEYWQKAEKLGSTEAAVRIAFAKLQNNESREPSEDFKILRKSAEQGSVLAQAALAYCYEKGLSVKQNKSIAASLYREAAQRGSRVAYNSLKKMYDEIRPGEEQFVIYD